VNKAPMADLCSAGILLAVLGVHPALGEPAGRRRTAAPRQSSGSRNQ